MNVLISQDEIISGVQNGSEQIHQYIYEVYRDKSIAYVLSLNNNLDANGIYVDSVLDLFKAIKDGKKINKTIEAYLMGIIYFKVLKQLKDKNWNILFHATPLDMIEIEDCLDDYKSKKLMDIVKDVVESLEKKCRICLLLKYYENKNLKDIAQDMGLAHSTVKGDLSICRKKLRLLVLNDPRVKELLK